MLNRWGVLWQTKERVVLGTGTVRKGVFYERANSKEGGGGVLGAGQNKKGGLQRGKYLYWTYRPIRVPPPPGIHMVNFTSWAPILGFHNTSKCTAVNILSCVPWPAMI